MYEKPQEVMEYINTRGRRGTETDSLRKENIE